jgi:hypothetical protein
MSLYLGDFKYPELIPPEDFSFSNLTPVLDGEDKLKECCSGTQNVERQQENSVMILGWITKVEITLWN